MTSESDSSYDESRDPSTQFQALFRLVDSTSLQAIMPAAILDAPDPILRLRFEEILSESGSLDDAIGTIARDEPTFVAEALDMAHAAARLEYQDILEATGLGIRPGVHRISFRIENAERFRNALKNTIIPADETEWAQLQQGLAAIMQDFIDTANAEALAQRYDTIPRIFGDIPSWLMPEGTPIEPAEAKRMLSGDATDKAAIDEMLIHTVPHYADLLGLSPDALEPIGPSTADYLIRLGVERATVDQFEHFLAAGQEGMLLEWALLRSSGALGGSIIGTVLDPKDRIQMNILIQHIARKASPNSIFKERVYNAIMHRIFQEQGMANNMLVITPAGQRIQGILSDLEQQMEMLVPPLNTPPAPAEEMSGGGETMNVEQISQQVQEVVGMIGEIVVGLRGAASIIDRNTIPILDTTLRGSTSPDTIDLIPALWRAVYRIEDAIAQLQNGQQTFENYIVNL